MNTSLSSRAETAHSAKPKGPLCDGAGDISPVAFCQPYEQAGGEPVLLSWSQCGACSGWFADPMPTGEQIARHWERISYADLDHADEIGDRKLALFSRVFEELDKRVSPGPLLDIGCNFGKFLTLAKSLGWKPAGYEPNTEAARCCVEAGFDVRSGWDLNACGFGDGQFSAITVIDVFCYSLHPFNDLQTYHRLLRPGGVLAMRLTNKHAAIRFLDRFTRSPRKDAAISRLLLAQFHSASPATIRYWLKKAGFADISIQGRATTGPWSEAGWRTRLAYGGAELLRFLTLGTVCLSPGILVFARRPV
jgi:SAM-dependent methyltransferase